MKIAVRATFGERCMAFEDGVRLFEMIHDPLRDGGVVEIDFAGVRVFAAPFFNAAIGRLYADIPAEAIASRLRMVNINAVGAQTIRRVVDNSKQYFAGDRGPRPGPEGAVEEEPTIDKPEAGR
jgi:hypothetical protein